MFRKKPPRLCDKGHPQEDSWEHCPFCAAEDTKPSAVEVIAKPCGEVGSDQGATVVTAPRKSGPRRLAGWLVAMTGEQEGEDFRVFSGRNTIGKDPECDIVLRDAYVSERHAVIEVRENGSTKVFDLGSKHGVHVGENLVNESCGVRDGDSLRVGHTDLVFRSFPP